MTTFNDAHLCHERRFFFIAVCGVPLYDHITVFICSLRLLVPHLHYFQSKAIKLPRTFCINLLRDLSTHFLLGMRTAWSARRHVLKTLHRYCQTVSQADCSNLHSHQHCMKFQGAFGCYMCCQYPQLYGTPFHSLNGLQFLQVTYQSFFCGLKMFLYTFEEILPPRSHQDSSFFSSRNSFRSMIHFHTFICGKPYDPFNSFCI